MLYPETLAAVLGLSTPASNLGESDELVALAGEQGYLQNFIGFADTHRIVETFLTPPEGVNADLLRLIEYDYTEISEICRNEIREVAGIVPHMSLGYTRLDSERLDTRMV